MNEEKPLCFECLRLYRDSGYKTENYKTIPEKGQKCTGCGKRRTMFGAIKIETSENRKEKT